jgi:hypothetical protein
VVANVVIFFIKTNHNLFILYELNFFGFRLPFSVI